MLFLVQNKWYVKQNLRGRWSGFGMARSWDRSQLIWDESQHIVRADTQPTQTIFFNHSLSINPKSWPWYHLGRWAVQRQGQHQQCQGQERSPLLSEILFPLGIEDIIWSKSINQGVIFISQIGNWQIMREEGWQFVNRYTLPSPAIWFSGRMLWCLARDQWSEKI